MAINKKELDGLLADDKGLYFVMGLKFAQEFPDISQEMVTESFAEMSAGTTKLVDAIFYIISETIVEKVPEIVQ